jgi:hypothetical protein
MLHVQLIKVYIINKELSMCFSDQLKALGACSQAVRWAEERNLTLEAGWMRCQRIDWLLWLSTKMMRRRKWSSHSDIVRVCHDLAKTTQANASTKHALQVTSDWLDGKATPEDLKGAINAIQYPVVNQNPTQGSIICSGYNSQQAACATHVTACVYDLAHSEVHAGCCAVLHTACAAYAATHGLMGYDTYRSATRAITAAICSLTYAGIRDTLQGTHDFLASDWSNRDFCTAFRLKHVEICDLLRKKLKTGRI